MIRSVMIASLMLTCSNAFSQQVLWLKPLSGDKVNSNESINIADSTIALIKHYMPNVSFTDVVVNNSRAYYLLDEEPNACAGNKLKTAARMERYYFTDLPQTLSAGLRLYVVKGSVLDQQLATIFATEQTISLRQTLSGESLKVLGVVGGRAYGKKLDDLLADKTIQHKIWSRTSSDMFVGLLKMLLMNRLQAIIEYPSVVNRYDNAISQNIELSSYPVKEASPVGVGYIMCSKTAMGKSLISQFNRAIEQAYWQPEYFQVHLEWNGQLTEIELRRLFNQVYPFKREPI
ncbi:hypothetical protein [Neptunicella sp.]|uniref:hypothetical protein n=1 Tax=Neptunicella sp. TaxID=2125986 RepID=UPI003F68F927